MTIETTTITVSKIRDNEGEPTCFWWEHCCPFFMTSGFGTREHCFWMTDNGKRQPLLKRRNDGSGTTIPHEKCPVWNS